MKPAAAVLVGLLFAPGPLSAQAGPHVMVAVGGEAARFESTNPTSTLRLTGEAVSFAGRLRVGPVQLDLQYLDGKIGPGGGAAKSDLVEGWATLGVRPASWLAISVGPRARAIASDVATERWLAFEAHARGETAVLVPGLVSYCDVWHSLGGSVNFGGAFGGGQGVAAGLSLQPPRFPLSLTVGYRVERSTLSSGTRSDTVEHLVFAVGLGKQ
jgi:hypothetical protein